MYAMAPKCTDCFYCRRGCIITYQPAYTCLHPLVMQLDVLGRIPALCDSMRNGETGACGREGALFRPQVDDTAEPIHKFRN
jgi:hypothetical protein